MVDLRARVEAHQLRQGNTARSVMRAARREGQTALVELARDRGNYFASSKAGYDYPRRIATSMQRYAKKSLTRPNLFAFVMPAGHGKTHYAREYGFVDVDDLLTDEAHNSMVELRTAAIQSDEGWGKHNEEWVRRLDKALGLFDYSAPVVILVHHEETALELGATVLAAMRLRRTAFERNIRSRSTLDKFFSRHSYDSFEFTAACPNRFDDLDNRGVESAIIHCMNINNLPVACPYKFSVSAPNRYYARSCPLWVAKGDLPKDLNLSLIVDLYEQGAVPRECVDYYVSHSYTATFMEFGVRNYEWAPVLADMAESLATPQQWDVDGDYFEIFPPREAKEASRANITIRRLAETFDIFSHQDAVDLCAYHVGSPHVFVASILCAWKGELCTTEVAHIVHRWFAVKYSEWPRVMKKIHGLIRTSRFLMGVEITESTRQKLMYLDLLVGRASYVINELAEVEKRGGDKYESDHLSYDPTLSLFTASQYREDFKWAVKSAYSRVRVRQPKRLKISSFREFYRRRKEWLTKGSLVYNNIPSDKKKFTVDLFDSVNEFITVIEGRHNKQSLMEHMEFSELLSYLGDPEVINATKTMVKYETGGKERVLLPGTMIHFIIFSYVLYFAEQTEQIGSVRLNAKADEEIVWFDRKMTSGLYHILYDWADFNEQHSADEMAAVIAELEGSVRAPTDYAMFVSVIVESMYNMVLVDRDGHRHKLWKGLFSGWRGTTWVNSVLNYVYLAIAIECYKRMYGEDPVVYVDHGGDDVDGAVDNAVALSRLMGIMDSMLFNANAWKQMFSRRSEFFRNTITSDRAYASPTRALASFVAGDWEGTGNVTVRERVVGLMDQVAKMIRRGVSPDFANGLGIAAITHWSKIRVEDSWLSLPPVVIHGDIADGGLGVPDQFGDVWRLRDKVPDMDPGWLRMLKPHMLASSDYVEVIRDEVEGLSLELTRMQELSEQMARGAYDVDLHADRVNWRSLCSFTTTVTSKTPVVEPHYDAALFEEFLLFKVDEDMDRTFSRAVRFSELAGHLQQNGNDLTKQQIIDAVTDGTVPLTAIEFNGDVYYRRLVPDFIAYKATHYCRAAIVSAGVDREGAEYAFRVICYMARDVFGHEM